MNKILISGVGADLGQSVAKIVRLEYPEVHIWGIDSSDRHAGQLFVDTLLVCPKADDKNYLPFIEKLIKDQQIDLFIPCTEFELRKLNKSNNSLINQKTLSCDQNTLTVCLDKYLTFEFLKKLNIAIPWYTISVSEIQQYPCIYKARSSSGSKNIFQVSNATEAQFLSQTFKDGLFQEYLPNDDEEYTCSIFRGKDKKIHILQLIRKLTDGATSWCQVKFNQQIENLCIQVTEALNASGSLNIQLRLTDKGPMIFEINPRFSSTVFMRHLIHFNDLKWSIDDFINKPSHQSYIKPKLDTTLVKTSTAQIITLK